MEQIDVGNGNSPKEEVKKDEQGNRLFTQEEVDKIIKKRLERHKTDASATGSPDLEEREAELKKLQSNLKAREQKLDCKEYLQQCNYPAELIDIIDTSDIDKFKEKADAVVKIDNSRRVPPMANPEAKTSNIDNVSNAFSIKNKHVPKDYFSK